MSRKHAEHINQHNGPLGHRALSQSKSVGLAAYLLHYVINTAIKLVINSACLLQYTLCGSS